MASLRILLFIPFLLCASLFGGELSLAELIDIALKNNPETQKVWANVKRAQAAVGVAQSSLYPHVEGQGSVNHAREVKFPNGSSTTFTSGGGELNLNYLLLDFGERSSAIQATKEALQSAKWWADFSIQKIMSEVASNYYEYLNASELLEMRKCSLQDANTILEAAEEMCKAGLRVEGDLITAQAAVAEIHMYLAQERAAFAIAYGKLMNALGLPMETQLQVKTRPEGIELPIFSEGIESLIAIAEEKRKDLLAKQASYAEMQEHVSRAKKAPLPKLRAMGQAGWFQYSKHQGSSSNYNAGIALDIPIFKGFQYSYETRQALANAEMTAAELKDLHNAIALEVLTYSELVKASREALKFSELFLDQAFKSYEGSLERYKAGLLSIFDSLQAQRYLAEARSKKAQARTQWLMALAQLAYATGSLSS